MSSFWSLFSATLWFSLVALLLYALHRRTDLLTHYGVTVLSAVVALTIVRLLLPLDSDHMIVVRSYTALPVLDRVLRYKLLEDVTIESLLAILWLSGSLLGLVMILCGALRDRRRLKQLSVVPMSSQVLEIVQKSGANTDIVHITPEVSTPMVIGLFRPTIYLPLCEYSEPDLLWILRHEVNHFTGHDAWLRLGFLLFRCLFWWNPLVHFSQKLVDDVLELRCDKAVLSNASAAGRLEYVEALYHAASQTCRDHPSFMGAGSFVQSPRGGVLAVRAKLALEAPRPHSLRVLTALALSVALFTTSYIFVLQPAGFPPDMDDGVNIYVFSPENAYLRKVPSGDYELWSNGEYAGPVSADARNDELFYNLEVLP